MKQKIVLVFIYILNILNAFAQGPALGIQSPNTCKILKDVTFTTIDQLSQVTTRNADDGSYAGNPITLPFNFSFFGKTYNKIYLNINGNITFDTDYSVFNAESFKIFDKKMIAPFWADIDLVLPGEQPVTPVPPTGKIHFKVNSTNFIVIWENVGYFENKVDKLNTFQLVITNGNDPLIPNGGNVAFYYDKMNWTSGHASLTDNGFCGIAATVGITNGDKRNYFQIGRFDHLGDENDYDGVYESNTATSAGCNTPGGPRQYDGVKWLEKRCDLAYDITKEIIIQPTVCNPLTNSYDLNITYFIVDFPTSGILKVKVDGIIKKTYNLPTDMPNAGPLFITINDLNSDGTTHTVSTEFSANSERNISKTYNAPIKCVVLNCEECVTSFSPYADKDYLLSAWVKETYSGTAPLEYAHSGIRLTFKVNNVDVMPFDLIRPSGPIVDGWQRIEYAFKIPATATDIHIKLTNESTAAGTDVYFDDIRMHPYNSNMKSFVYDPSTQKLLAELDENNFATLYEYDDEGILIRVKKETERGVMTIKETRSNQSKIVK